jgi:hypothetical protein
LIYADEYKRIIPEAAKARAKHSHPKVFHGLQLGCILSFLNVFYPPADNPFREMASKHLNAISLLYASPGTVLTALGYLDKV